VEFKIAVKSQYSSNVFAQNVIVKVPTPLNTATTKITVTSGKAKYNGSENAIVWKVSRFGGKEEIILTATAELTSTITKKPWSRPPISIDFQVRWDNLGCNVYFKWPHGPLLEDFREG
jgi:AP-2 complex subunit mu-1